MADNIDDLELALRGLIIAHGRTVRSVLARSERSREDVDELWADVFMVAFSRLGEISQLPVDLQRRWMIRTASYLLANHGRRKASWRKMLTRLSVEPLDQQLSPEDVVDQAQQSIEDNETSRAIAETLQQLRPPDRQVLVLDALGHDGPSIGRHLGITSGAARKRLMIARIAFREHFAARNLSSDSLHPQALDPLRTES